MYLEGATKTDLRVGLSDISRAIKKLFPVPVAYTAQALLFWLINFSMFL